MHKDNLAYGLKEYSGELYRMIQKISCSQQRNEEGCLFFKVSGKTNISEGNTIIERFVTLQND